jgi:hypothetical protein
MTDKTVDLDGRRGMEALKATDLRRLLAEVEAKGRDEGRVVSENSIHNLRRAGAANLQR